jgi:hypothetical protein
MEVLGSKEKVCVPETIRGILPVQEKRRGVFCWVVSQKHFGITEI